MGFMDWLDSRDWATTGGMLTAAFTGATAWMMWRNTRKKPRWAVTGAAHRGYEGGRPTGTHVAELEVHNTGDGDAFDVRLTRCNGGEYKPRETFEAARLNSGGSFTVTFDVAPDDWGTAWFEIISRSTQTRRGRPNVSRRYLVGEISGPVREYPPVPGMRSSRQSRGKRPAG